jgi:Flp pilus assembly protein TadG
MERTRGDAGSVTAETAVVLPALVLVLAIGIWVVGLVGAQLRCVDAAGAGARAAARGEAPAEVVARVRAAVGAEATVEVERRGDTVVVSVSVRREPGGVLGTLLPAHRVDADATAQLESGVMPG